MAGGNHFQFSIFNFQLFLKRSLLMTAGIICCSYVKSQDVQTKQWTLKECIEYAVGHNIDIRQRVLQKENAEIDLHTSKMSRLPDLNAGLNQNWGFGRSNYTESGLYENTTKYNSGISMSSSMPIFTGFRINNQIDRNKLELEAAVQNLEKAKDDLALNVASLYLQALFNKEILKVSEEQLNLSRSQVKRTEILVESGKVPVSQLYDIKAQVAKDEVSVVQAANTLQLSLLDLAQSLELEQNTTFDIVVPETDLLLENSIQSILSPDIVYDNALEIKPQIKEYELKVKSAEKSLKIAESGYYPSLNLSMGYSTSYYYDYGLKNLTDPTTGESYKNRSFSDQFRNNAGEYIGLSLNIPIFNRFSVKNQVKSARLGIQNQQLILDNTKKTLYKEIQTAYYNAVGSREKYNASNHAVEAGKESFKYAEERYKEGKSTVFEFNEARNKLIQSLSEQIQAKYDYIFRTKILDFYNGIEINL